MEPKLRCERLAIERAIPRKWKSQSRKRHPCARSGSQVGGPPIPPDHLSNVGLFLLIFGRKPRARHALGAAATSAEVHVPTEHACGAPIGIQPHLIPHGDAAEKAESVER